MSIYLDPTGRTTFGIGICARCSKKFFLDQLYSDPNAPGLMVCKDDLDDFDPYRLPARQAENITLPFTRPDAPLTGTETQRAGVWALWAETELSLLTESGNPIFLEGAP